MAQTMKDRIQGSNFSFKEAIVQRSKPSRRLQALVGEQHSADFQPTYCLKSLPGHNILPSPGQSSP